MARRTPRPSPLQTELLRFLRPPVPRLAQTLSGSSHGTMPALIRSRTRMRTARSLIEGYRLSCSLEPLGCERDGARGQQYRGGPEAGQGAIGGRPGAD